MAHPLGGWMDLPHGLCNAILLDKVVSYNFPYAKEKYKEIAELFSCKITQVDLQSEFIKRLEGFKSQVGLIHTLSSLGVQEKDLSHLSNMALKDACIVTNPTIPTANEIEDIYAKTL